MEELGRKGKQNTALKMPRSRLLHPKCVQNLSESKLKGSHFSKGLGD